MCVWARVFNYRWLRAGPIDCDPPGCVMDVIAFLPVLTKRDLAWEEYSKGGELFSVDESDGILFRLLNYFPTVFASFPLSLLLRRHPLCGQINRNSCFFPFALVFWIFHFDSIRYIYIYMFEVLFIGCKISTLPLRFIERLSPICHGATNISRAIFYYEDGWSSDYIVHRYFVCVF